LRNRIGWHSKLVPVFPALPQGYSLAEIRLKWHDLASLDLVLLDGPKARGEQTMRTETHGDFTQRSWSDTFGQRHCEVTHAPTGLKSVSMSFGMYAEEIDAWKGMAMKLGDSLAGAMKQITSVRIDKLAGPLPPMDGHRIVRLEQQQPLGGTLETFFDVPVRIDEL
jgi:hypothetical protein